MLENKEYCKGCKTFVVPEGALNAQGLYEVCPVCGEEIKELPKILDRIYREQYLGAKVQEMLNARFAAGTLTKAHLVFWAEYLVDSERYQQYKGKWSNENWKIAQVPRDVKTKLGQAFLKGDVTLVETTGLGLGPFFNTGFSFRNSVSTAF